MQFPYSIGKQCVTNFFRKRISLTDKFPVGMIMLEDTTLYSCRLLSFVFVAVVGTVCFLPTSKFSGIYSTHTSAGCCNVIHWIINDIQ